MTPWEREMLLRLGFAVAGGLALLAIMVWVAGCSASEPWGHAAAEWHRSLP